jgi:hypothetical protein
MSCGRQSFSKAVVFALLFLAVASANAQTPAKTPTFVPGSWSLVLLPDTQNYSDKYPGLFALQTHWIAKNKDKFNIRYVLGLGDITNHNADREWRRAQDAYAELDGRVPYALVVGNHDYTPVNDAVSGKSGISRYFPASKFQNWPTFGGTMKPDDMMNAYHLFSAGGIDWIILALEWAPNNQVVQWANDLLAKHPKRRAILVTHAYLYSDATRYDYAAKGGSQKNAPHSPKVMQNADVNDGEELWQKLVRKNNFTMVLCGHVGDGYALLSSKNDLGKTTHQILVDYQHRKLGGEGYLRILEFLPDRKTVRVKSYSPLYDKYLEEPNQQFQFELDP